MNDIARLDEKITAIVDRLNTLVEQQRSPQFIKLEFKRFVELVTEKHKLLLDQLLDKKYMLKEEEYDQQKKSVIQNYKTYLMLMAVLIDQELARAH